MLAPNAKDRALRAARLFVGDWWVDPSANELGRGTERLRVEPKAMQVLVTLAAAPARVVGRDELLAAVWPGVVVGDEVLTQTIIKLRKALGDDKRAPLYIETIAKRGYRLIAPVRGAEGVAATAWAALSVPTPPPALPESAPPAPARARAAPTAQAASRRRPLVIGLAAATVLGAVALAYLGWPGAAEDAGADAFAPVPGASDAPLTVSVLPFESLGADERQAYLARGIGHDLVTDLSRLPELRVIRAGGSIGAAPAARYLVHGSVQRDGAGLRVNIHVVDTSTGQQLWSERFERPFGDLFSLQDQIVGRIAAVLPGKLSGAAKQQRARRYTRSLEAYDLFLRAQALFLARQADVLDEARALYRRAVELDPRFARAYAGLAMTYALDWRLRRPADAAPAMARALELAETARSIDPEIAEVYWALAFVHVQSRRHDEALRHVQRAIELNRSFADAYALAGGIRTYVGQASATIPLLRTALRLNPEGGYLYFLILGRAYLFAGDVEQALINLRQAAARNPADLETRAFLAAAHAAAGDGAEAQWEAAEVRAIDPGVDARGWLQTYPLAHPPYRERLLQLLARAGL